MENVAIAFLFTLLAGLSTGIGGAIAFFAKNPNTRFLSISLGFSAGVMIYVSLVEILFEAQELLTLVFDSKIGTLYTIMGFFGGILLIAIIDYFVPEDQNPHEVANIPPTELGDSKKKNSVDTRLMRTGLFTALAIAIHNFPEGIATFVATIQSPTLAIPIVIAIAIHNIPEGIAVSTPIYYATGDRKKAFFYSFASGLSEPLGALVAYLILLPFMNDVLFGIIFAGVAGIMVFISLDELLPAAIAYGEHHLSIYGLIAGMFVMAMSLWLFI